MRPGIVCKHVGSAGFPGLPVLLIAYDKPVDERDSGLCLACGAEGHETADYLVINLDRVVAVDASVGEVLDTLPEGHQATRSAPGQPWLVEPLPADEEAA